MDKLKTIVPAELSGRRLDQALASLFPEHSRSRLQSWISAGHVRVNNEVLKQKDAVKSGQAIEVTPVYDTVDPYQAQDLPLSILYEDDQIIVLDKAPGLVVHPGAGNPDQTLQNALLFYDPDLNQVARAGIVHRLDKDTSGLMVVARTPTAHTWLVDQIQQRKVKREYQAIVTGVMTAGGTVEAPIGRHRTARKRMAVTDSGKPAVTHYRVIKRFSGHTHILLTLETGRTHQIRVHMAHLNFPVTGDREYGTRRRLPKNIGTVLREKLLEFPRQALHACRLSLIHPGTQQELVIESPLPADIQDLLECLRQDADAKKT